MPWSYPDNVPISMKYFKPSIQKKAISIANAILKNGGSEGTAIATGIKRSKGLIKLASNLENIKNFVKSNKFALGAVGLGAGLAGLESKNQITDKKFTKGQRVKNAIVTGALFGASGWGLDRLSGMRKNIINRMEKDLEDPRDINSKIRSKITEAMKQEKIPVKPGGYHRFPIEAKVHEKGNYRTQLIKFTHGKDGIEKLSFIRDGKFLKEFIKQLHKGNKKYLVDNYNKLIEKTQEPIL
jgi:uncharacterized protein YdaT